MAANNPQAALKEAFSRAAAVLTDEDVMALKGLAETPDAMFSIGRPLRTPSPASLEPMQADIADVLREKEAVLGSWDAGGVTKLGYLGATYFDGEPQAHADPTAFCRVNNFMLAVGICARLPVTAARSAEATFSRMHNTSPRSTRIVFSLSLTGNEEILSEYAWAGHILANALRYKFNQPTGVPIPLAYLRKSPKLGIPHAGVTRVVGQYMKPGDTVELDRVRLRVHSGESPYKKLE